MDLPHFSGEGGGSAGSAGQACVGERKQPLTRVREDISLLCLCGCLSSGRQSSVLHFSLVSNFL